MQFQEEIKTNDLPFHVTDSRLLCHSLVPNIVNLLRLTLPELTAILQLAVCKSKLVAPCQWLLGAFQVRGTFEVSSSQQKYGSPGIVPDFVVFKTKYSILLQVHMFLIWLHHFAGVWKQQ